MPFTITKKLQRSPSYSMLCKLAGQNQVHLTGDERVGSFSGRGVTGDYNFSDTGIQGSFAGLGITGQYSVANGLATVTISDKPFWLPETLLKQKITEGLDLLGNELAESHS